MDSAKLGMAAIHEALRFEFPMAPQLQPYGSNKNAGLVTWQLAGEARLRKAGSPCPRTLAP